MAFDLSNTSGFAYANSGKFLSQSRSAGLAIIPAGACPTGTTWSVGFWFQRSGTLSGNEMVVGTGNSGNNYRGAIGLLQDGTALGYPMSGTGPSGTTAFNDGQWHFMLVASDGTADQWSMAVDGVQQGATISGAWSWEATGSTFLGSFTGSDYTFGGLISELSIWSVAKPINYVPTAALTGNETSLRAYYPLNGTTANAATSAPAPTASVPYSNAVFSFSPINWSGGMTITEGAYFRTSFSGATTPEFVFDTRNNGSPLPLVEFVIDNEPQGVVTLASSMSPPVPSKFAANSRHTIEFRVVQFSYQLDRFATQAARVQFVGVNPASGSSLIALDTLADVIGLCGDSISSGFNSILNMQASNANDPSGGDVRQTYAWSLRSNLGCELGINAMPGSGASVPVGTLPKWADGIDYLWSGQPRLFSDPKLRGWLIEFGTNEALQSVPDATVTADFVTLISKLLAYLTANQPIVVLQPFNGSKASAIQAAVAQVNNSRVHYVTVANVDNADTLDSVHPQATGGDKLGRRVANAVRPIFWPTGGSSGPSWTFL